MRGPTLFAAGIAVAVVAAVLGIDAAAAHSYLRMSVPADGAVVTTPPREVRLVFSEPVEVRFSIFRVYPLNAPAGANRQQLNRIAALLVNEVLRRRGDETARADDGLATTDRVSAQIVIRLKENLTPGHFVVMWRVLSIDTHTTQGFFVFTYRPAGRSGGGG
ncbi:MAG: copper resistance protein CopC [Armatimonadota bacterium]|nr:copper resistance protein CopC [Armatimonadota bacterium]MDR5697072.1 copper resistance protein CopC [Armatimonadota bacterium]